MRKVPLFEEQVSNKIGDTSEAEKLFTIRKTRGRERKTKDQTGTLAELIEYFSYTLKSGNSYNSKIPTEPKTIKALVKALNDSIKETQSGSYNPDDFELVENPVTPTNESGENADQYPKVGDTIEFLDYGNVKKKSKVESITIPGYSLKVYIETMVSRDGGPSKKQNKLTNLFWDKKTGKYKFSNAGNSASPVEEAKFDPAKNYKLKAKSVKTLERFKLLVSLLKEFQLDTDDPVNHSDKYRDMDDLNDLVKASKNKLEKAGSISGGDIEKIVIDMLGGSYELPNFMKNFEPA